MIRIVTAYPDFLNLYGEYANAKLLAARLKGCGERVELASFTVGEYSAFANADLLLFGAGTEDRMLAALVDFKRFSAEFSAFLSGGGRLLATGSSLALFCRGIFDARTGVRHEGLGVFDAEAGIVGRRRYGELACETRLCGEKVLGCVNSSIDYKRGEGQNAAFTVLWDSSARQFPGSGEGLEKDGRFFATELTGPLFFRNPALLDLAARALCKGELPECAEPWYAELQAGYGHALAVLRKEAGGRI